MTSDQILKELETALKAVLTRFQEELQAIRSNRPSVEIVEEIRVMYYDQPTPIKQLGSISIVPPRDLQISVWDKAAVGSVAKAIEDAKIGLRVTNDGNTIKAYLPALTDERREEIAKLTKKMAEGYRIQIRARRDEAMKKVKAGEDESKILEDEAFKAKEKIQKQVDDANKAIEASVDKKLKEINE